LAIFLLWALFLKSTEVAHILVFSIPRLTLRIGFDKIMRWAKFWSIFSQTRLVALAETYFLDFFVGRQSNPGERAVGRHCVTSF
jgi:hypothetical protein